MYMWLTSYFYLGAALIFFHEFMSEATLLQLGGYISIFSSFFHMGYRLGKGQINRKLLGLSHV